jgi:glycosyltransferase involved in cell wall biosynthesis
MKIIVSHIGKQHVNALLLGLSKHNVLTRFYTSIAANKFTAPQYISDLRFGISAVPPPKSETRNPKSNWLGGKLKNKYFVGIEKAQIVHFPFIAAVIKMSPSEYWCAHTSHKWFDKWVANRLKKADFDALIGYENCNLMSFKVAKQRGKITVLDLASVHHNFQNPVLTQIGAYTNLRDVAYLSQLKDKALAFTDYIIALSTFAEKTLIENGFPAERIYKTYLGINQSVFTPKKVYNTEGGVLELYFVGTLSHRKGFPFMLTLLNTLIERGLNIRLTVIGPVDDVEIPDLDVPYFRYIPFLPHAELVKLHHTLDLFIFPSHIDSWAQVVIEAMACGSPVLVSENTGAKDAVEQGGGVVLPVGNLMAWVSAIEFYYHNRSFLQKTGEKAAVVAQQYTWEAYHQQVFDVMTDIMERKKKPKEVLQL